MRIHCKESILYKEKVVTITSIEWNGKHENMDFFYVLFLFKEKVVTIKFK